MVFYGESESKIQEVAGMSNEITRRKFIRDGAAVAAALTAGLGATQKAQGGESTEVDTGKILNYNPDMQYRRCGRTGLMVSAVALGGHWKRLVKIIGGQEDEGWMTERIDRQDFQRNRYDVVTRCIECGINYVDACCREEILAYAKALKDRREKMYFGYSWHIWESRFPEWRSAKKLQEGLDRGMRQAGLAYVDLWRISLLVDSGQHSEPEIEEAVAALDWAKKTGRARFIGISSHDRPHIKWMIETYPKIVDAVVTPYTAKSKELPKDSLFQAIRKHDVGMFGIKPYSSGSLFKGDGTPDNAQAAEDDRRARLAIRYILTNPAVTAPIPGMIHPGQVDNAAKAVQERRKLDLAEAEELRKAMDEAWANLPENYQWLKDWEYV